MTAITVMTIEDRLSLDQRRLLARTLTDAVLVPEVGQVALAARAGFQVHFVERAAHRVAIGGVLAADHPADIILIDIAVMQAAWPMMVRAQVIANVYEALAEALETATPSPAWWVNFRMIEEGSWDRAAGRCRFSTCWTAASSRRSAPRKSAWPWRRAMQPEASV